MTVAIFGAGAIGGAVALRLAERGRVARVTWIDENASVAAGKALDILQSGPLGRSHVTLTATADALASAGADAIVLADDTVSGAVDRERGLALVERLVRAGATAPIVFAAPTHLPLMEACARELGLDIARLVATAPAAMESVVASLVHIETGRMGASVTLSGRPPAFVIGWTAATIGGAPVSERIPAHRLLAISQSLPRFWPPGPQVIAAATARVVEGLLAGSRRLITAAAILDGELGVRGRAGLALLELGGGRILRREAASLSPQERTETTTALLRG
jgi:malate dehydrogenase